MIFEIVLLGLVLFCAYKIGQWSVAAKCLAELQEAKFQRDKADAEVVQLKFACELFKAACAQHVKNIGVCTVAFKRIRTMVSAYRIPQWQVFFTEIDLAERALKIYEAPKAVTRP